VSRRIPELFLLAVHLTAHQSYDEEQETISLNLEIELVPGESIKLEITYIGQFKNNLQGLYQAKYTTTDENGVEIEHRLAATSLEPTYARQARCACPHFH
jgi:aminopeptidase N